MGRDAVPLLQVVLAMVTDLGVAGVAAAEPARPLLAAVVPAARVLAEVAAHGSLVAQERRGSEAGGGRYGCVRLDQLRAGELGEGRRRPDPHAVAVGRDLRRAPRPAGRRAATATGCPDRSVPRGRCRRRARPRPSPLQELERLLD